MNELERLIAEQERDDRNGHRVHGVSLDALSREPDLNGDLPRRRSLVSHEHGTIYAYHRQGCRCEKCREAARIYQRARRAKARAKRLQQLSLLAETA